MNYIQILLLAVILILLIRQSSFGSWHRPTKVSSRKLILDSSGLIDGRVIDIVSDGFVADELIVPQFIVNELQLLADGHDTHKRERARFGLDVIKELQLIAGVKVVIDRTTFPEIPATDDKLVALAKRMPGVLYTTDYNLSKVAVVEGLSVLNVNELAQHLRPVALPGETINIKIVQKGSSPNQGVGYLDDGTMVVVDGAAHYNGKKIKASVDRMHQTVAGKMVFATLLNGHSSK